MMMKRLLTFIFCFVFLSLNGAEEKKVALLFITRTDLNQTEIWKQWIDFTKYNVYNHPGEPASDPWFAQFLIAERREKSWGHILYAQQALLKEALKDPSNYKFVFLSESDVPIRTTDEVYNILVAHDCSWMRWHKIWWNPKEPNRMLTEFPEEHRWGNSTWFILNRKHAQMFVDDDYWIHIAMTHEISDESYASSFYSMKGVLLEFRNELTTYVDWERGRPYYFKTGSKESIKRLLSARNDNYSTDPGRNPNGPPAPRCCMFARKIAPEFPKKTLEFIINNGK